MEFDHAALAQVLERAQGIRLAKGSDLDDGLEIPGPVHAAQQEVLGRRQFLGGEFLERTGQGRVSIGRQVVALGLVDERVLGFRRHPT